MLQGTPARPPATAAATTSPEAGKAAVSLGTAAVSYTELNFGGDVSFFYNLGFFYIFFMIFSEFFKYSNILDSDESEADFYGNLHGIHFR